MKPSMHTEDLGKDKWLQSGVKFKDESKRLKSEVKLKG